MVWFQCEDCGENLKKPKLANHFKICSAYKLSCIDCGETFGQQSVQSHTQCVTEAEKYGPKGQGKTPNVTPAKSKNDSKQKPDVDVNVGLSSRPPWHCSLCNTSATSKQTLLLHAEGKKHRAKARAFHASKQPPKPVEDPSNAKQPSDDDRKGESALTNDEAKEEALKATQCNGTVEENGSLSGKKKRKHGGSDSGSDSGNIGNEVGEKSNGEVIQAKLAKEEPKRLKQETLAFAAEEDEQAGVTQESSDQKIKWKKLITSILKSCPDGALKMKKLQKLVLKSVQESGTTLDESKLKETIGDKAIYASQYHIDINYFRSIYSRHM
ncbi:hypothetical protein Syun_011679 [Stephania yunnanensis]|uniref:U1-type domain-containing protein n=1 Tax=Stephania yunnanensis TaxID=152371 RepID=A0AAP0JYR0_9MAGN